MATGVLNTVVKINLSIKTLHKSCECKSVAMGPFTFFDLCNISGNQEVRVLLNDKAVIYPVIVLNKDLAIRHGVCLILKLLPKSVIMHTRQIACMCFFK